MDDNQQLHSSVIFSHAGRLSLPRTGFINALFTPSGRRAGRDLSRPPHQAMVPFPYAIRPVETMHYQLAKTMFAHQKNAPPSVKLIDGANPPGTCASAHVKPMPSAGRGGNWTAPSTGVLLMTQAAVSSLCSSLFFNRISGDYASYTQTKHRLIQRGTKPYSRAPSHRGGGQYKPRSGWTFF